MFHILALALAASLALEPAQVTDPQSTAAPITDARLPVAGGVHVRLYAVTGKSSRPLPGARCAAPVQALPADLDADAIARSFGANTAARLWHPSLSAQGPLRFFGVTRLKDGRLFLGLVGQADDGGTWDLHLTLRDMEGLPLSGPRDVRLAPGGAAWIAEPLRGQCIVVRLSADAPPDAAHPAAITPAGAADDDSADEPRVMTREITPPMLVKTVEPVYPLDARKQRRAGTTSIQAVLDTDGTVTSAEVTSYPEAGEDLAFASLAAMSQWKYRPASLGGQPVRVYFTVQVTYRAD